MQRSAADATDVAAAEAFEMPGTLAIALTPALAELAGAAVAVLLAVANVKVDSVAACAVKCSVRKVN